ncbi:MAG TPA: hypothetical protein VMV69_24145 [Pirellulales bacterium]|nr:hypothetical protein [Pirellulales bacterium]
MRRRIGLTIALLVWLGWFPALLTGQESDEGDEPASVETPKNAKTKAGKREKKGVDAESGEGADDLFEAVKKKKLQVHFVPQNAALASLTIGNTTDQPVKVRIPLVVAGTPTMPTGVSAAAYLATYGTAPPQTVAGVTRVLGQSAAPQVSKKKKSTGRAAAKNTEPPKGPVLTLQPGETRIVPVACVGLEFGKPNPLPIMPYTLVDIEKTSKKPEVKATLEGFAQGKFNQQIAQLIAWHFNGGMTWNQLAQTGTIAEDKLQTAMKAAEQIEKDVKAKSKEKASKVKNKSKPAETVD